MYLTEVEINYRLLVLVMTCHLAMISYRIQEIDWSFPVMHKSMHSRSLIRNLKTVNDIIFGLLIIIISIPPAQRNQINGPAWPVNRARMYLIIHFGLCEFACVGVGVRKLFAHHSAPPIAICMINRYLFSALVCLNYTYVCRHTQHLPPTRKANQRGYKSARSIILPIYSALAPDLLRNRCLYLGIGLNLNKSDTYDKCP